MTLFAQLLPLPKSSLMSPLTVVSVTGLPQASRLISTLHQQPCLFCWGFFCPLRLVVCWREEAGACTRERNELPARLGVSGEPWQAPRLEVPLPFPLAVVTPEAMGLTHVMDRKRSSGYGGACIRCSKGSLFVKTRG